MKEQDHSVVTHWGGRQERYREFKRTQNRAHDPFGVQPLQFGSDLHYEAWVLERFSPTTKSLTRKPTEVKAVIAGTDHSAKATFVVTRRDDSVGHPSVERFAALRRLVTEPPAPGESRSELRCDRLAEVAASPVLVRLHHAHTLWGDPSMGLGLLKVRTESFRLAAEDGPLNRPKFFALVRGAVIGAFEELATRLAKHVRLKEMPPGVENAMHSAARVDLRVSTVPQP